MNIKTMPITGLPVILETAVATLMQESALSSFKVLSNRNGTSTVVIKFASMTGLASEQPPCSPRVHKSPSQVRRDKQRQSHYYNVNKAATVAYRSENHNTPCPTIIVSPTCSNQFVDKCVGPVQCADIDSCLKEVSTNTCVQSDTQPVSTTASTDFDDSNNTCVTTNSQMPGLNSKREHNKVTLQYCTESTVNANTEFRCDSTLNPAPPTSSTYGATSTEADGLSNDISDSDHSDHSYQEEVSEFDTDTERNKIWDRNLFNSEDDLATAQLCTDGIPEFVRRNLKNTSRNTVFHRIALQKDETFEGGKAYILETDDLLYQFFPLSKTIGRTCVLEGNKIKWCDKLFDDQFKKLPRCDVEKTSREWSDMTDSLRDLLTFIWALDY